MVIESEEIKLNPGIRFNGAEIKTARVRLLPRRDRKAIDLLPPEKQDDMYFIESISRLGNITDRNQIATASEELLTPDEERIWNAMKALREQYQDPGKSTDDKSPG